MVTAKWTEADIAFFSGTRFAISTSHRFLYAAVGEHVRNRSVEHVLERFLRISRVQVCHAFGSAT